VFYDVAKAAVNRMAFGMARDLRPQHVAVVALAPGFVQTERVLAAFSGAGQSPADLESPEYIGRAVLALAGDVNAMTKSGRVLTVGQLARNTDSRTSTVASCHRSRSKLDETL
jgi:NAD(P)-dependent dehydrogenase (short-subunit alcohol dehydrogenase family)